MSDSSLPGSTNEPDLWSQPPAHWIQQPTPFSNYKQPEGMPMNMSEPKTGPVTVQEARDYIRDGREKGVFCPCCNQFAKVYKRQIHSTIAKMLIRLYLLWKNDITPDSFHHLSAILDGISSTGINDFSKLIYWELIEEQPKDEDKKTRTTGYWRITERGKQFVRREISIEKYAHIYDNHVVKFEGPLVDIGACLGKKFDYEQLMSNN